MNENMIPITDSVGRPVLHNADDEPNPGSVVLTEGEFGSAWQRYFSDGLWHPVRGSRPVKWEWLTKRRNLVLVYEADERIDTLDCRCSDKRYLVCFVHPAKVGV